MRQSPGADALTALSDPLRCRLRKAGRLADRRGVALYLVGGVVRDALLGRATTDADLVVEGDGLQFAEQLKQDFGAKTRRHRRFGTATVILPDRVKIDVATARSERYPAPAALPVVQPGDIQTDLGRRDFAVNAMAVCLNADRYSELVDPYDGLGDLRRGLIRILHDRSFIDDPTRLFRAARFEQRLEFRIETHTGRLFGEAVRSGLVDRLSGHRILEQLRLIFEEAHPWRVVERLAGINALQAVYPHLRADEAVKRTFGCLHRWKHAGRRAAAPVWILYLLGLASSLPGEAIEGFVKRLRPDNRVAGAIRSLPGMAALAEQSIEGRIDSPAAFFERASPLSVDTVLFCALTDANAAVRQRCEAYYFTDRHVRLSIDGHTLSGLGIPQGPVYRRILDAVLAAKLNGAVRSKAEEYAHALAAWEAMQEPS